MTIEHKIVPYQSKAYHETIRLREIVLRIPLGMSFTKEQLEAENNQIHIAQYIENVITSCLVMKPIDSILVKMRQVAVHPDWQGKGLGKQLVAFTEQEMNQRGFKTIELHARDTAIPFYEKLEYKVIGDQFDEIGIPHYKMRKLID